MANMLANSGQFKHQADMEEHSHSFGAVSLSN